MFRGNKVHVAKIIKTYSIEEWDAICRRCGYCCAKWKEVNGKTVHNGMCSHLNYIGEGKTECDIYPNCYGTDLGDGWSCVPAEYVFMRAPDCPYNEIVKDGFLIAREEGK